MVVHRLANSLETHKAAMKVMTELLSRQKMMQLKVWRCPRAHWRLTILLNTADSLHKGLRLTCSAHRNWAPITPHRSKEPRNDHCAIHLTRRTDIPNSVSILEVEVTPNKRTILDVESRCDWANAVSRLTSKGFIRNIRPRRLEETVGVEFSIEDLEDGGLRIV